MDDDSEDARAVELETLEAIWPEIRRLDDADETAYVFEIELPVELAAPITVTFPAPAMSTTGAAAAAAAQPEVDSLSVSHLPSLQLRIRLPQGYPDHVPPEVSLSTTPQWLGRDTLKRLEDDGPRLWDDLGHDMVAFNYIDHLQRSAEDVFGATTADGTLQVDPEHKLAVLDYDIKAKKAAFEKETFDCGVCLDPKKGSKCHKMLDCDHVFCLQCLQDFYNDAITSGNLSTVRCLDPNCARDRQAGQAKKPKLAISPSELLQIGLAEDAVKRYVTLKYKTELESDKNTIYCPRQWCSGAARSKKHKKPVGLEFAETSDADSGSESEKENADESGNEKRKRKKKNKTKKFDRADLLSVCEDCGFAFCSSCYQSWHGEFFLCVPRHKKDELTPEDMASLEYLRLHSSPCPTCNAPAQKTHGCNHMICSRCDTHFCYLCSSWLDPVNPYRHYNQQGVTSCYMRLWELEEGDGNDAADMAPVVRNGGQAAAAPIEIPPEDLESDDEDEDEDSDTELEAANANANVNDDQNGGRPVEVAREAPLVLRLMDNQPRGGRNGGGARAAAPDAPNAAGDPAGGRRPNVAGRNLNANAGRGGARGGGGGVGGGGVGARAGRAGGRGGRGGRGGGAANRNQNVNQQHQHQNQNAPQRRQPRRRPQAAAGNDQDELGAEDAAWVRHFVQMALIDAEDHVFEPAFMHWEEPDLRFID